MTHNKRIIWVDMARSIGIIAIVLGHVQRGGILTKYLMSFHTPLFFFLSGVVFNNYNDSFKYFIKKKAVKLLLPYYVVAIISEVIFLLFGRLATEYFGYDNNVYFFTETILNILCGKCKANSPLWFLPCMFIVSVVQYKILKYLSTKNNLYFEICVFLSTIFIAVLVNDVINSQVYFYSISTAVQLIPFVLAGYLFNKYHSNIKYNNLIINVIYLIFGYFLAVHINSEVGYLGNYYGNSIVFFISALMTITGLCLIVIFICERRQVKTIGKHTLIILLLHKFPVMFFQILCPFIKDYLKQGSIIWIIVVTMLSIYLCIIAEKVIQLLILKNKKLGEKIENSFYF